MKDELKKLQEALTQVAKYQMDEPDHEGEMAKSQMLKTMKYAADIMNMIDDTTQLPAWVQAKLAKIAEYIGAVKHHMESKTVRHVVTNMMETKEPSLKLKDLVNEVVSSSEQNKIKQELEKIVGKKFIIDRNYDTRNYEFYSTDSDVMVIVGSGEDVGEDTKYAWSINDGRKQYVDGSGDNFGRVLSDILKSVQKYKKLFETTINEGPSSEELRMAQKAIKSFAKYRRVDDSEGYYDLMRALKSLENQYK